MSLTTLRDGVLDVLHDLTEPHRYAHRCYDGIWYATAVTCPSAAHAAEAHHAVERLHSAVRDAAKNTPTAVAVAEGMTGLDLAILPDDEREGWTLTARRAMETLADTFDAAHDREQRAAAARARTRQSDPEESP